MSGAGNGNSFFQVFGTLPGIGQLEFRHLDALEGGNMLKDHVKTLHSENGFDTEYTPPYEVRRLVGVPRHTRLGISKMPDYIVVWKAAPDGDYSAPIVLAIAHSADLNADEADPNANVAVWRLRYRKHKDTLRLINDGTEQSVRQLQNTGALPNVVPLTRDQAYKHVMAELMQRIKDNQRQHASAMQNSTVASYADAQSGSEDSDGGSSMSSISAADADAMKEFFDSRRPRQGGLGVTQALFDGGSGSGSESECMSESEQSNVSFTSTEFLSDSEEEEGC